MQAIADAIRGQDSEHFQEAVRVLDIMLRQHAAQQWVSRCFSFLGWFIHVHLYLLFRFAEGAF